MRWVYDWGALAVLGALIYYIVRTHHVRASVRQETREIELAGWVKLMFQRIQHAWQCPFCGAPVVTIEGVRAHQDPDASSCAWLQVERAADLLAAEREAAERPPEVSVSNARPDSWPALGTADPEAGEGD